MMKSGKAVFVVDSVEDAVKFYSDKLAFDIVNLEANEGNRSLKYAELKKGKSYVLIRIPKVDELVEFSQVKYCMSRGAGFYSEMKKGIDKYYQRCKKKGLQITQELKDRPWGHRTFIIKDPFGFKLTFAEPIPNFTKTTNFMGISSRSVDDIIEKLKEFGLSRRSSKKYAKLWLKRSQG